MPKPIILIACGKRNEVTPQGSVQTITSGCNMDYIQAVVRAGGAPLLVPCIPDTGALEAAVQAADALLLTGGGDVNSLVYGQEPHPQSKYQDPVRDEMEFTVTRLALERGLPILAVCRGAQLLNVALGGTLIQDIPTQVKDPINHYSHGTDVVLLHSIDIETGTLLHRILESGVTAVNSYHHQTVDRLGAGLRVNSRARDGVVEGIEAEDGRPVLGVQFHPEECAADYPQFQRLFDWLVRSASELRVK